MFGCFWLSVCEPGASGLIAELTSGSVSSFFEVSSTALAYFGSLSFVPAGASSTSGLEP